MDQSTKAPKTRKRDPETKLAQHRLSVLELAKELGNVADVGRQPPWPVPTTSLAGGAERKTGMPVCGAASPA